MTLNDALNIRERFDFGCRYSEDDFFMYTEAMQYLIEETKSDQYMLELGCAYNYRKDYELARKYFELASSCDNEYAKLYLGYIWMYGRTGVFDYKKAFEYFSALPHNINAQYKVADMYRNGYYVKKDPDKYKEIIEALYKQVKSSDDNEYSCKAEISLRLAGIRAEEGKTKERSMLTKLRN